MLVGCPRERERAAISEVRYFIEDILGDTELSLQRTHIVGLVTCQTGLDPFEVVHRLHEMAIENPYQFRFAIRFTPLEVCVRSNLEDIIEGARGLLSRIGEEESFRVTVRRRHTELENMQVVLAVAGVIPRRVNLDNADKTVWVEIVGEKTGISVLSSDQDILSIMSMRDDMY
jgi:tRNA acetyltransferase TAN1